MKKIARAPIIIFIIITVFFGVFNKEIMPGRKELTKLELVKVIGMDKVNDGKYRIEETVVRVESPQQKSSNSKSGGTSTKEKPRVFTTKAVTFSDAIRSFQTYVNKVMAGSHISCMLLGEDFCKNDLSTYLDFNIRDYEVRLNSHIYVTKNSTAKEFLNKTVNSEYSIDEKIISMEESNDGKGVSHDTSLMNVLSVLAKEDSCGLIPTLEIIYNKDSEQKESTEKSSNNIEDFQTAIVEPDKEAETFFDFGGFAIIHKRKLAGYLDREESITTNILKNRLQGTNMNIELNKDEILSFTILDTNTKYDFKFDGDKLSEVIIKTSLKANFEEINSKNEVFCSKKIDEFENKISDQMKKEIEKIIEKIKEVKCDFINIEDSARIKHPYKYKKIKDNWVDELVNAKITIEAQTKIVRTYDVLKVDQ